VAEYLLQHRGAFNLPRKYKIAFSGCGDDCALASIADLGFFARERDGERGFKVFAGGGLGGNPRAGVVIEEFIPAGQAMETAEAVRRVFDKYGDRTNRNRARLRYVLKRVGEEAFKALYREERDALRAEGLPGDIPVLKDLDGRFAVKPTSSPDTEAFPAEAFAHLLLPEKTPDTATLRLPLALGDISANDLEVVARVATLHGVGLIGTTQLQELLVYGVPRAELSAAFGLLRETKVFAAFAKPRPRVVSCAGASTCKLGLCLSRGLSTAVSEELDRRGVEDAIAIRISGCPNSCGGHHIGVIGLEGGARRHNGRIMPTYQVLAGGVVSEDGATLAEELGAVPAKRVPELIAEALVRGAKTPGALRPLVAEYGTVPEEVPEDFYYDFGSDVPFSLAGRGPGECASGVFDVMQADLREAATALKSAETIPDDQARSEALYHAVLAAARALLPIYGVESTKEHQVFEAFQRELVQRGWVAPIAAALVTDACDWRADPRTKRLTHRAADIAELVRRVSDLFASLDSSLKFRLAPLAPGEGVAEK